MISKTPLIALLFCVFFVRVVSNVEAFVCAFFNDDPQTPFTKLDFSFFALHFSAPILS